MRALVGMLLAGLVAVVVVAPASGNTYKPTRTDDPVPGKCKPDDCSLREAISAANKRDGKDKVSIPKGRFLIELPDDATDDNDNGDFDVTDATVIVGKGKKTVVDGNGVSDVFSMLGFDKRTVKKLTVTGGIDTQGGGGITTGPSKLTLSKVIVKGNTAEEGAGIRSVSPQLTIKNSTISGNTATAGPGGGISMPAGIVAVPRLEIRGSTIDNNQATTGGGIDVGDDANTGGDDIPVAEIVNSTIAENQATANGGGVVAEDGATLSLDNTTVGFNIANSDATGGGGGGGIFQTNAATFLVNDSVLASNSFGAGGAAPQCLGTFDGDENVVNAVAGCTSFNGAGNLVTATEIAQALAKNGGPTKTMALPQGSPAIKFVAFGCPSKDQRGEGRPDELCDSGSYEKNPKN